MIVRCSYLQCGLANEQFKGTVNEWSTSMQRKRSTKYWYIKDIGSSHFPWCVTIIPLQIIIASAAVVTWHLQIGLCRNSKKINNGCSISCGQTRLILYCMEQLTHTTVESGQRRTYMLAQRNPYKHHILLFGVTLLRKLLWVSVSLKSLVQD